MRYHYTLTGMAKIKEKNQYKLLTGTRSDRNAHTSPVWD